MNYDLSFIIRRLYSAHIHYVPICIRYSSMQWHCILLQRMRRMLIKCLLLLQQQQCREGVALKNCGLDRWSGRRRDERGSSVLCVCDLWF